MPKIGAFQRTKEIFPFFCFDLYSNVPNGLSQFDLRFNSGQKTESYLYLNNDSLNKIEAKYYRTWLRNLGESFEKTGKIDYKFVQNIINKANTVELVHFEGKYQNITLNNPPKVKVIKKIK